MSIWFLVQIIVNLVLLVGIASLWIRLKRPPKDDPRLSRGLQLLQSKISVLEDLSDRTDRQVNQLTQILENKSRQLQSKFFEAEKQVQKLKSSMDRSMEVASIFQDKIPHDEIIERQNTIKQVQAARMANKGYGIEEILAKVDLPREQVEFIAKVNKDELVFDENQLPAWVTSEEERPAAIENESLAHDQSDESLLNIENVDFEIPNQQYESLKKLGAEFKEACKEFEDQQEDSISIEDSVSYVQEKIQTSEALKKAKGFTDKVIKGVSEKLNSASEVQVSAAEGAEEPAEVKRVRPVHNVEIQKVEFPKVDINDNLT